jgi:hypothetical protein
MPSPLPLRQLARRASLPLASSLFVMFRRLALSLPKDQVVGTSTTLARCYATPAKGAAASKQKAQKTTGPRGSRGGEGAADSRVDLIKKVRFPPLLLSEL